MRVDEVLSRLEAAGLELQNRKRLGNGTGEQLRYKGGAIVSVYDKGTFLVQGTTKDAIEALLSSVGTSAAVPRPPPLVSRKVFVVYGHDITARTQLEAMLRRWDLDPLILDQLPSEGQTIIEKLERYTGGEVRFAVVLATPDDIGYAKAKEDEKKFRARQNVVLELGLLLKQLGRPKVAILIKNQDQMERPSDIQGLIYLPFRDDVEEVKLTLAKEMTAQGIPIEIKRV